MHSYFFHGQIEIGVFYWPKHSWETWLSKEEVEEEKCLPNKKDFPTS